MFRFILVCEFSTVLDLMEAERNPEMVRQHFLQYSD